MEMKPTNSNLETYATEIVPNLWVGSIEACGIARKLGFTCICVLERHMCLLPDSEGCVHNQILEDTQIVPTDSIGLITDVQYRHHLKVDTTAMAKAINLIDKGLEEGPVLVHCYAGIERSPLTVAVWLVANRGYTLEEAYILLQSKRDIVEHRGLWLE